MKIEPNIIDEKIEKEGLYADITVDTLQEKLDAINFQLDSINMQLDESVVSIGKDEKARLLAEKSRLEEEKIDIEYKIAELKEKEMDEESELESAEAFEGSIGKAFVPKVATVEKKKARKVDEDLEKASEIARKVNDEFSKEAEDMMSKMDDLFR